MLPWEIFIFKYRKMARNESTKLRNLSAVMSTNLRHETHRRSAKRKAVALNLTPTLPPPNFLA